MGFFPSKAAASLVVVSALFLASASAVAALPRKLTQENDDLITKLCSKTKYIGLCISSVKENNKGHPTIESILIAEIDAATNFTKVALDKATALYNSSISKVERELLSTCQKTYGNGIGAAADAKAALRARNASLLNSYLNAVSDNALTCEDTYAEFSLPSPLKELDDLIDHLAINCLILPIS